MILDDFSENDPFYSDRVNKTMRGRYGNLMMINNDFDYKLKVNQGEVKRFYVTNTANTRTFDFVIEKDGEKMPLKIVGGDDGRVETEYFIKDFIISPAERYIFEAKFNEPGKYIIKSRNIHIFKFNKYTSKFNHLQRFSQSSRM